MGSALACSRDAGDDGSSVGAATTLFVIARPALRTPRRSVGLPGVLSAIAFFNSETSYPGWRAALPTGGTLLVLPPAPSAWLNRARAVAAKRSSGLASSATRCTCGIGRCWRLRGSRKPAKPSVAIRIWRSCGQRRPGVGDLSRSSSVGSALDRRAARSCRPCARYLRRGLGGYVTLRPAGFVERPDQSIRPRALPAVLTPHADQQHAEERVSLGMRLPRLGYGEEPRRDRPVLHAGRAERHRVPLGRLARTGVLAWRAIGSATGIPARAGDDVGLRAAIE